VHVVRHVEREVTTDRYVHPDQRWHIRRPPRVAIA
jgi:hypothetical protein